MTVARRRWFRFSLRTLFVMVTVTGCTSLIDVIPRDAMTSTNMTVTSVRVGMYCQQQGKLPQSLDVLPVRPGYVNDTTDGWKRPLVYRIDDDGFGLTSLGKDGVPGGSGDDADITKNYRLVDGKPKEVRP